MKINLQNCQIGTISTTVDKGVKVVLYTPELSPEDMASLFSAQKKGIADELEFDYSQEGKTPSERLRNVLYVYFDTNMRGKYKTFSDFYLAWTEKKIEEIKTLLPPIS